MIRPTPDRVPLSTAQKVQEQIEHEMECTIAYYAQRVEQIEQRLIELEGEWDTERTLELNAGLLSAAGGAFALLFGRKWALLPLVVGSFLAQHAVQGWCPPLPILRRLGVRTQREIDEERFALKALLGDFKDLEKQEGEAFDRACNALAAVRSHRGDKDPGRTRQPWRRESAQEESAPHANIPPGHVSMVPGEMGSFGRSAAGMQAEGDISIP